jgi:histidine kinase/histidine kinase/DNA gyrase B/HSP90-like ATPase
MTPTATPTASARWSARFAPLVRAFHSYGNWLVSISWKRFFLLSLLLLIGSAVLQNLPPFSWRVSETVETKRPRVVMIPSPPKAPAPPTASKDGPTPPATGSSTKSEPLIHIEPPKGDGEMEISIGSHGVRITPRTPAKAASAAEAAASAARAAERAVERASEASAAIDKNGIRIVVPPGSAEVVREAIEEARRGIEESIAQAREDAEEAKRDAEQARREAEQAIAELGEDGGKRTVVRHTKVGEPLPELAFFWIVASMIMKITYKGQLKAQAQAAQATEVAESEQLKRQVVEARMAAMQAQVEPHFLFNTLASIDHLIETDPPRASTMQKNLIALLRASMPTMREANNGGPRDLGREMAVIRPYLEILKVRMEERLATRIDVPDGLLSAEFPSMMIQSLVENAIKHGLEPKPEGGELAIKAEIVHGKLAVTVADTGLGFGKAATAGTGVGLANIRERLALLYGSRASLSVKENQPSGTVVTIAVPYTTTSAARNEASQENS